MNAAGLPILTYHAFDLSGQVTSTCPRWFETTLARLTEAGLRALDLESWIASGRPSLPRTYAITIDDGLRSILDVAEILQRYKAVATVFLVTDRVGSDNQWPGQPAWVRRERLLSWSEIADLQSIGVRFAAHGQSHIPLDRCDDRRIENELRASRVAVEQKVGQSCSLLAYPYGRSSRRVREAAQRQFQAAFGTRFDLASQAQDRFDLSRLDAYYFQSAKSLDRLTAAGVGLDRWLWARRALRAARSLPPRLSTPGPRLALS